MTRLSQPILKLFGSAFFGITPSQLMSQVPSLLSSPGMTVKSVPLTVTVVCVLPIILSVIWAWTVSSPSSMLSHCSTVSLRVQMRVLSASWTAQSPILTFSSPFLVSWKSTPPGQRSPSPRARLMVSPAVGFLSVQFAVMSMRCQAWTVVGSSPWSVRVVMPVTSTVPAACASGAVSAVHPRVVARPPATRTPRARLAAERTVALLRNVSVRGMCNSQ